MDRLKEFFACLALKHTPRLGPVHWKAILAHYDSVYEAVRDSGRWPFLGLELRYLKAVTRDCGREIWREKAEAEYKLALKAEMQAVTWFDPRFPKRLKELDDPPCLLYAAGDLRLLRNPGVAVVGARECTAFGLEAAGSISTQLSRIGVTVVSGLALGIDRQAHLGGLRGLGRSIAVLGCGLDVNYPQDNLDVRRALENQGLVVTEYGPGVGPRGEHFPVRNRIISGLSLGVLVAEAAHRSGSLITARLAAEQGREVFALPGPIGQPTFTGCHRLIKQGAALVENAEDIVEILRYDFSRELEGVPDPLPLDPGDAIDEEEIKIKQAGKKRKEKKAEAGSRKPQKKRRPSAVERESIQLNDEEKRLMALLDPSEKMHIDAIGRQLDWPTAKVSKSLILLEMRGAVQQLPGMWYLAKEASS